MAASDTPRPGSALGRWAWLSTVPRVLLGGLLLLAILDLLAGVFLRYIVVRVTDYFDWPAVSFFWVEEVGEFTLAWLTLVGAALGIGERVHFALGMGIHRLSARARRRLDRGLHVLIAAFGILAAVSAWRLTMTNSVLTSAGLGINLGWLYFSGVVGGALIGVYGLAIALGLIHPAEHPDLGGN